MIVLEPGGIPSETRELGTKNHQIFEKIQALGGPIQGWQMDEEMESVLLELSSDGSYKCGLAASLTLC